MINPVRNLTKAIKKSGQAAVLKNCHEMENPEVYRAVTRELLKTPQLPIPLFKVDIWTMRGLFMGIEEACQGTQGKEMQTKAEAFLRSYFSRFFSEPHGQSAIEFAQYLIKEFLSENPYNTALVFHLMGASGLEKVTKLLAPSSMKDKIYGLFLNCNILGTRKSPNLKNYPLIVRYFLQEKMLENETIIFVDTAYNGSLPRMACDLLNNLSLIKYVQEEFAVSFPRTHWDLRIRMYFLNKNYHKHPSYDISGYNHVRKDLDESLMSEVGYIIDQCYLERPSEVKGISLKDSKVIIEGEPKNTICRQIMEEEMLKAARRLKIHTPRSISF